MDNAVPDQVSAKNHGLKSVADVTVGVCGWARLRVGDRVGLQVGARIRGRCVRQCCGYYFLHSLTTHRTARRRHVCTGRAAGVQQGGEGASVGTHPTANAANCPIVVVFLNHKIDMRQSPDRVIGLVVILCFTCLSHEVDEMGAVKLKDFPADDAGLNSLLESTLSVPEAQHSRESKSLLKDGGVFITITDSTFVKV